MYAAFVLSFPYFIFTDISVAFDFNSFEVF